MPPRHPASRRARRFRRDDGAVIDLPLKLLVTAVVLAIGVPATLQGFQHYARNDAEQQAAAALAELENAARQALSGGVGTRLVVDLDFSGSGVASIVNATAGASLSDDVARGPVLAFQVEGRARHERVTDPNVFFQYGENGGAAVFLRGTYKVSVTHATGAFADQSRFHYAQIDFINAVQD